VRRDALMTLAGCCLAAALIGSIVAEVVLAAAGSHSCTCSATNCSGVTITSTTTTPCSGSQLCTCDSVSRPRPDGTRCVVALRAVCVDPPQELPGDPPAPPSA